MTAPLIFDIKRATTADGPGLRTAVFFKGCNLRCTWCHNPEGQRAAAELAVFREKCIGCGACRTACATPEVCSACGACTACCPTEARRLYGRAYGTDELLDVIAADQIYYDATGGGVTFSGGECMLYPAFLAEMAGKCREKGISVAIDTAGHVPFASFEAVLPYTDLFLYDIKCLDPELHRRGTGVDNRLILSNLQQLQARGKQVLVRIPVIPDFNDGAELARIKEYCERHALTYETLPYHAMGESKARALSHRT
ncbi:MAG: glycyl-radical enzyme activating protein [Clostridia bacterium]|nr:glycyl-radical enzyme activating protein [Clostridia bacterium]